jgi:micrococcal nuclease
MKLSKKILLPLALLMIFPLASCTGPTYACETMKDVNALLENTPLTDSMKLKKDYVGKKFAHVDGGTSDHIGVVTVSNYVDGDTVHFKEAGFPETIKVRFQGVNTPESTAKVEPWGKKASIFTHNTLEKAAAVLIENDVNIFEEKDSSGGRWMGFVWYKKTANGDWRCLNLELVEQGYSLNYLFETKCPYYKSFAQAEENARKCGVRVPAQVKDPDHDYSNDVVEVSIREITRNYDEYGISDVTGSTGKQLKITALIVGMIGDNLILRDVKDEDEETGEYASLYLYAGFGSGLAGYVEIGYVVSVYCRAGKYNDNIQLTDPVLKTTGKKAFKILSKPTDEDYGISYHVDMNPYLLDNQSFTSYSDFDKYKGYHVAVDVTIRYVTPSTDDDQDEEASTEEQYYYKKAASGAMTVYAWANESAHIALNIRKDASCTPPITENDFIVGHTYRVVGYLTKYFDKYQVMVYNQIQGQNYITDITPVED